MTDEQKARKAAYMKIYRQTHKQQIREYKKKYREENKEKISAYNRWYRWEHGGGINAQRRLKRQLDKEQKQELQKRLEDRFKILGGDKNGN